MRLNRCLLVPQAEVCSLKGNIKLIKAFYKLSVFYRTDIPEKDFIVYLTVFSELQVISISITITIVRAGSLV